MIMMMIMLYIIKLWNKFKIKSKKKLGKNLMANWCRNLWQIGVESYGKLV
jgi:hypothetical protein